MTRWDKDEDEMNDVIDIDDDGPLMVDVNNKPINVHEST